MDQVTLNVVGVVRNRRDSRDDRDWGPLESAIETKPEFAPGLLGLEGFTHALVMFWTHLGADEEPPTVVRRPRGRSDMPLTGVFAQRGRMRPNPIGVTAVEVVRVEPGRAIVRGLDAVDGTPVLDLKPYVPAFDRRDARVPTWMDELMKGYF